MLKIMTLNLNYTVEKHGPWETRREIVHQAIQNAGADILAFQAVRKDPLSFGGKDQAAQLAEALPEFTYHHFAAANRLPDGVEEGSAFLSRMPIAETSRRDLILLPSLEDTNPRVLLQARFDRPAPALPLHIFNAHFSWVSEQARLNLDEALVFVQLFRGPALLVGDLNTPADSDLLERLRQAGWIDAWAELHPEEAGLTFESDSPSIRIDYVWVSRELRTNLRAIDIAANSPHPSGARASDHYGLVVTLDGI